MPALSILHGLKNKITHLVDSSSKAFNHFKIHSDGKSDKKETAAQTPVSSFLPQKESPQEQAISQKIAEAAKDEGSGEGAPDVLLDVPSLKVNDLKLNLDDLDAHVALQSDLGDLIKINVGVRVNIKKLDLDLKGVDLKAVLKVRLKEVNKIFSKAFEALENDPDILTALKLTKEATNKNANESVNNLNQKPSSQEGKEDNKIPESLKTITQKDTPDKETSDKVKDSIEGDSSVKSDETRHRLRIDNSSTD